jgi:hypothetical protein
VVAVIGFEMGSDTAPAGWLTKQEMTELVERVHARPGWKLVFTAGGRLEISAWVDNSRYEANPAKEDKRLMLFMPRIPPEEAQRNGPEAFLRWVLYEYLWLTMHEELEWFRDRKTLQPMLDPHASAATATGLLPPRPGEEWWKRCSADNVTADT